jgi:hypothetical protein
MAAASTAGAAATQPSRKRTLLDAIAGDEPTLQIQLACGARVPAHRELLQFFSTCVKGLPDGADVWDVSGLLVDGRPASRAVVAAWLEEAYAGSSYADSRAAAKIKSNADAEDSSEDDGPEEEPEGGAEGDSAFGFAESLLLFADAVGSSAHVIRRCYRRCADDIGRMDVAVNDAWFGLELSSVYRVARCKGGCRVDCWPEGYNMDEDAGELHARLPGA